MRSYTPVTEDTLTGLITALLDAQTAVAAAPDAPAARQARRQRERLFDEVQSTRRVLLQGQIAAALAARPALVQTLAAAEHRRGLAERAERGAAATSLAADAKALYRQAVQTEGAARD